MVLKILKKSQSVSQDLLHSSFEANSFVYGLPVETDYYELQTHEFLILNGNVRYNILFDNIRYTNDSNTTSYIPKSTEFQNINRHNFNKVLNIYISNGKGQLTNDTASFSDNQTLDINASSSLLYA